VKASLSIGAFNHANEITRSMRLLTFPANLYGIFSTETSPQRHSDPNNKTE